MKYFFIFLSFLIYGISFAETIQHVEYHLPKAAENWTIGNQFESKKGTMILYIPQNVEKGNAEEFFGVHASPMSSNPENTETIKFSLTQMFPKMLVDFHVLEKDTNSVTYEWSVQDNGVEKFHGWGRAFSHEEGSVLLNYQSKNTSNIPEARSIWLQALKEAKLQEEADRK